MRCRPLHNLVFWSTLLLTATYPLNRKPANVSSGSTASIPDPAQLTNNLSPEKALRAKELLNRSFNPCPELNEYEMMLVINSSDPLLTDKILRSLKLREDTNANACGCYDAVNYILFGDRTCAFGWESLLPKLKQRGYTMAEEIKPFEIDDRQRAVRIKLDLNRVVLKPEDVLLWAGLQRSPDGKSQIDNFVHAAVYLGEKEGHHYVFEKMSLLCGPESPFGSVAIEGMLIESLGNPVYNYPGDANYGVIQIWRENR